MLIVLKRDYGQLGNRLHTHANLLAWCIENDLDFINLSFITEAKHFESKFFTSIYKNTKSKFWRLTLNLFSLERILKKIALSDKWIKRLSFLIKCYDCDDTDSLCVNDLNKILKKNKYYLIVLIRAWNLNCNHLLAKHSNIVKNVLKPRFKVRKFIDSYINELPEHDYLVGVHVRRGDYKFWENGKFYYSWHKYARWIDEINNQMILKSKFCIFIICSNEKIPDLLLNKQSCFCPMSDKITEIYLLAKCNIIIGPPSSFGSWAQFYQNNERICIDNQNFNIKKLCLN